MLTELREKELGAPYPAPRPVTLPEHEAAWYRALYQYVAHLVNRSAWEEPPGQRTLSPTAREHRDLAARCARLLVWAAQGEPVRTLQEPSPRLDRFRTDVAALGLAVLSGELLVLTRSTAELPELARILLDAGRGERPTDTAARASVDVTTPVDAGRVPELVLAALAMDTTTAGRSRLRYALACLATEAADRLGRTALEMPSDGASLAADPHRAGDPRVDLVRAAWLLLDDAVLGTDLAHWAWRDPTLALLRRIDRASFAAAAGPEPPAPPAPAAPPGTPSKGRQPTRPKKKEKA